MAQESGVSDGRPNRHAAVDCIGRLVRLIGTRRRPSWTRIASLFDIREGEVITPRHNDTYLGKVRLDDGSTLDVAATSSGMGAGSTEIVVSELIQGGARRLVRVGTSGSVQHQRVKVGSFVIVN